MSALGLPADWLPRGPPTSASLGPATGPGERRWNSAPEVAIRPAGAGTCLWGPRLVPACLCLLKSSIRAQCAMMGCSPCTRHTSRTEVGPGRTGASAIVNEHPCSGEISLCDLHQGPAQCLIMSREEPHPLILHCEVPGRSGSTTSLAHCFGPSEQTLGHAGHPAVTSGPLGRCACCEPLGWLRAANCGFIFNSEHACCDNSILK